MIKIESRTCRMENEWKITPALSIYKDHFDDYWLEFHIWNRQYCIKIKLMR